MKSFGTSKRRGFTLLELMVVVVVIAILAAIAYPVYTNQVRKGRRSDAFNSISDIQLREERWRADHSTYGTLANLGVSTTSPSGYYTLAQTTPAGNCATVGGTTPAASTANSYTVTATATGLQLVDTACATIALTSLCGVITKTPSGTTCWP